MGEPALQLEDVAYTQQRLTVEEYISAERESEIRHEFGDGSLRAMAGASTDYETVSMNVAGYLHHHLLGKPCQVFKDGMKVHLRIWNRDVFYYPDVMVCCDPTDDQPYFKERPTLIVEVLTEWKHDMLEKYFAYQHITSLEEYVVISQNPEEPRAWIFRRAENWQPLEIREGTLTFVTVDLTLELTSLYLK